MSRTKLGILLVALAANLVLAGGPRAGEAYACSCVSTTPAEELRTSDAVFSGKVASVAKDMVSADGGPSLANVDFRVEEVWKGVSEGSVSVYGYGPEPRAVCKLTGPC